MMRTRAFGLALAIACGGDADGSAATPPEKTTARLDERPDAGADPAPVIPLCPASAGPRDEFCQTLVYRSDTGYCQRWSPCAERGR